MSNRILGVLILLGFLGIIVAFYLYFFKFNKVNIEILSNLAPYKIELYSPDIKRTFKKDCEEKKCIFKDFSPFNYNVKIIKNGFRDYYTSLNIRDNGITKLEIILEKNIYLRTSNEKELNENSTVFTEIKKKDTKENIIKELRERKKIKKTFFLNNLGFFKFKKSGNKLELLINDKSLGLFENTDIETLNIREINYTDDFIFINIGSKKYIYNLLSKNLFEIKLNIEINYIKLGEDNLHFRLITDKGTFIYNVKNKELKYFVLFKDYEILGNNYIGIIYPDETEKFINHGYKTKENESLIIKYNKKTREKSILFKTKLQIFKIIKRKTPKQEYKIFLIKEENKNIYELMNF